MADLAVWQRTIVDEEGNVIPGAEIEVRREEDDSLATLYADRAGESPLANPLAADMSGFVRFFAQGDAYTITAVGAGSTRTWRFDPTGRLQEFDRVSEALGIAGGSDTLETRRQLGTFSSVAEVQSRHIPAVLESIRTNGYYSPGDGGGAEYRKKLAPEADLPGDQTAADGTRWAIASPQIHARMLGAIGDGGTDDTQAVQQAIDLCVATGRPLYFGRGTYIIDAVSVTGELAVLADGAVLKRPDDTDLNNVNAEANGIAQWDIVSPAQVHFYGIVFDGNESQQTAAEPSGKLVRLREADAAGPVRLSFDSCTFRDPTHNAIMFKGASASNTQRTLVVRGCSFIDGRPGLASNDPNVENANGYNPTYIMVTNHASVIITGNEFLYNRPLGMNEYGFPAVRLSAAVNDYGNDDGASAIVANNTFRGLGRSSVGYNGVGGNNGLGVVEFYAYGRELVITGNRFIDSLEAPIRGKTNADIVSIMGNVIQGSTAGGINISRGTFADLRGYMTIANNVIRDVQGNGISIAGGTEEGPELPAGIAIIGNVIEGVIDPDNAYGYGIAATLLQDAVISGNSIRNTSGDGVRTDRVGSVVVGNNAVREVGGQGIVALNPSACAVTGNVIETTGAEGIRVVDGVAATISANDLKGTGSVAISTRRTVEQVSVTGNTIRDAGDNGIRSEDEPDATLLVGFNTVDGAESYGIVTVSPVSEMSLQANIITNISGLDRGIYIPSGQAEATLIGNISRAASPRVNASGNELNEGFNSWN